jgi:hypothetical protein
MNEQDTRKSFYNEAPIEAQCSRLVLITIPPILPLRFLRLLFTYHTTTPSPNDEIFPSKFLTLYCGRRQLPVRFRILTILIIGINHRAIENN